MTAAVARWGLFGGSFDPPHVAHLALAGAALAAAALDEVRWVPAGQPWQKARALSAAAHREAMVALAIAGEPRFVLDRVELERPGPSYTLDTVRELTARRPGAACVLIVGADQYARLHGWHEWRELLARVELAVALRPGDELAAAHPEVRARPLHVLPLPPMDVSATEIRRRAAAGEDIRALVPPGVARYIESHRLYAAATGS